MVERPKEIELSDKPKQPTCPAAVQETQVHYEWVAGMFYQNEVCYEKVLDKNTNVYGFVACQPDRACAGR
jgi:hypothetical protein